MLPDLCEAQTVQFRYFMQLGMGKFEIQIYVRGVISAYIGFCTKFETSWYLVTYQFYDVHEYI